MNEQTNPALVLRIPLDELQADPSQPRKYFDKKALQELANDIAVRDIIEPIVIFINEDDKKTIYAGERRYRAAKLAGLETVPCVLRESETGMQRLLGQVSENFQREGLNPIEMALFFEALIKDHDIKPTEVPHLLVQHGFKKFDRSYISNIRRLLQLPRWAQTLIQKGTITGAHGKHLLQGMASAEVMAHMKAFLKKPCTTRRLQEEIDDAYTRLHLDVCRGKKKFDEEYGFERYFSTRFDWRKECEKCETCQIINAEHSTTLYCLNEECYDEKQMAAVIRIEKAEIRKVRAAETKRQKALEQQAQEAGVSVEEFEAATASDKDDPRAAARTERTECYLDEWLRKQLYNYLVDLDHTPDETRFALILWIAADKPRDYSYWNDVDLSEHSSTWGDIDMLHFLTTPLDHALLIDSILKNALNQMSRTNLRALAHYCQIKLDGVYVIDRDYLDIKTKTEIIETTPTAVIDAWDEGHWQKLCNKDTTTLKDNILNQDYRYGVPVDLAQMYQAYNPQAGDE